MLEYRYYLQKKDNPGVGFWIGSYAKYTKQIYEDIGIFKRLNIFFHKEDGITRFDIKKIGIGLAIGNKWIYKDKVILGLYAGIGGYVYAESSLVDNRSVALGYEETEDLKKNAQFRFGFNVGYRFVHKEVKKNSQ